MKKTLFIFSLILSLLILFWKVNIIPGTFQISLGEGSVFGSTSGDNVISGQVFFKVTTLPVQSGYVKALKYDWSKDMILVVDSAVISTSGQYTLPKVPKDSLFIMAYSDDEEADFPPGYHDTSINWRTSRRVVVASNESNVNISVNQMIKGEGNVHSIGGRILKDPQNPADLISDAVIYAKFANEFKGYSISDANGHYYIDSLPFGDIELVAFRIGYYSDYRVVQLGEHSMDTVDFYLARVSSIDPPAKKIPLEYSLSQNTPNPFNPVTKIKFGLPKSKEAVKSFVKLIIYDALGREVTTLVNQNLDPGTYEIEWDASNNPSGVYFYKLITENVILTKKMVLIK